MRQSAILALALALAGGVGAGAAPGAAAIVSVPGRASANVSIAADGDLVALAWSASLSSGVTDIFSAVSRDGGRTFSAPVRVNDVAGDARVSGEQPPRALLLPRPSGEPAIVAIWTAKGARGTSLLQAQSDDGGRTFGSAVGVPGGDAPGHRGWESMTTSRGVAAAIWLDHRGLADEAEMTAMHHETGQVAGRPGPRWSGGRVERERGDRAFGDHGGAALARPSGSISDNQ